MSDIRCVIFDLDGVLVHTDRFHEQSWKQVAVEEGIEFDPSWPARLRGVDRMQSLDIILERAHRPYTMVEKEALAARKNALYLRAIESITPADLAPGASDLLLALRNQGIRIAIASSSRNAPALLDRLGLRPLIDAVADGNDAAPAKPDPALFLLAAQRAGVPPSRCAVIEDAPAGVLAAKRAGMKVVLVGPASEKCNANATAADLAVISPHDLLNAP
jgi:beta-phosphoglucomutase